VSCSSQSIETVVAEQGLKELIAIAIAMVLHRQI
jgi:hypothetical protein